MKRYVKDCREVEQMKEFFYERGIKYDFERSGSSIYLKKGCHTYYSSTASVKEKLPISQISFISKVKRQIISSRKHIKVPQLYADQDEIKFVEINHEVVAGEEFQYCYIVDISSAYWYAARKLEYIDEKIFKAGKKVKKRVRLASLGSFAKFTYRYRFNGKIEKMLATRKPKWPQVFFNCAYLVYKLMDASAVVAGEEFLFYWTDGVYVKSKKAADSIHDYMKAEGFESTIKRVNRIQRSPTHFLVFETAKGEPKRYPFNIKTSV